MVSIFYYLFDMSRRISNKRKAELGLGLGTGADYKPWITTSEFNSRGTTAVIKDWKTGRGVHCLSQAEANWYYILRWDDNNIDIREQYPLDRRITERIAFENGFKHPGNSDYIMTTDFLATRADGTYHAYSIKSGYDDLFERDYEKLCIEKLYWKSFGTEFTILTKAEVNSVYAANIRLITEFWDASTVYDEISAIKHKLAHKEIETDLENTVLSAEQLRRLNK